ncbi:MAG: PD40 domain-containing protein, partial [Bacteroidales bacterium]|nr:PD40 domain-containing protein [Bacteroidales bacterium]
MKKSILLMTAAAIMAMGCKNEKAPQGSYIGPSDITISDGHFSPEVMLSLGRLSDPQLSPDGTKILYGVSYTSVKDNRSVRNLFICNVDGSGKVQLTSEGKSVSNARWSRDGKHIYYLKGGQLYRAPFKDGALGRSRCLSDVKDGIGEFSLSPDESRVMWSGTVPNPKLTGPSDLDPTLDKAKAYVTEDLMYRHWDHWVETLPQTYVADLGNTAFTQDGSVNILGEDAGKYELPIEPFSGLEQCSWSPDGRYIAYSCKKLSGKEYAFSTNTEIYVWDSRDGKTSCIPVGGGYDTDPLWSPDGTKLAWIRMARDGYEADKTDIMVTDVIAGADGSLSFNNIRNLT